MKFPSKKQIERALKVLENAPASRPLPPNATKNDIFKYEICRKFVIYAREHNMKQKDMAELLDTDASIVSKILHYHIEEFSVDRLLTFLWKLYPKASVKLNAAS